MFPVDFPAEPLAEVLDALRADHLGVALKTLEQDQQDEGITVTLLAIRPGPMYLELFLSIRDANGNLGVPLEAELAGDAGRIPLYRAEMPWWCDMEGVATLLAPRPPRGGLLDLRIRQVRLFSTGPGSRALKVKALSSRPMQPPPVKLGPGDEERYRASLRARPPVEAHRDAYGYWDFHFPCPAPALEPIQPVEGTLPVLGSTVTFHGRGPQTLYARCPLDWEDAYRTPPAWEGLTTVELTTGLAGLGTFRPDGEIAWRFPAPLPDELVVRRLTLYKIPAWPALGDEGTWRPRPFPQEVPYRLLVRNLDVIDLPLGAETGERIAVQRFVHGQSHLAVTQGDVVLRPLLRLWHKEDASDRMEAPTLWNTPIGQYLFPVVSDYACPKHWDSAAVNVMTRRAPTPVTPLSNGAATAPGLPFVPPTLYSTSPLRMA